MSFPYQNLALAGTHDDHAACFVQAVCSAIAYPGRLVYRTGVSGIGSGALSKVVKLPAAADLTARVLTFTPTGWGSGETATVTVSLRGRVFAVSQTWDTDLTTSLTALAAALNDRLDDEFGAGLSVVAANSGGTALTLTGEIVGEMFNGSLAVGGGTVVPAVTTAGSNVLSALVGMVGEAGSLLDSSSVAYHAANKAIPVVERGRVCVALDTAGAVTQSTQFYLDVSSGNEGKLTTTLDTNAIWLPPNAVRPLEAPASGTFLTTEAATWIDLDITALRAYVGAF